MATKIIGWNTGSGNITLTYQGQGDGTIIVQSDANDIGSARSQIITIETTEGSPVITKNLTISQAACPFPVGDVKNFSYTGSYQEVELPAGQYKLQCWGAQGGSNAAASSYSITAKAGGKGGYSEGIITLSTKTTVRVYVGGQGSASAGGFNGGGSTTGTSQYNASSEFGYSKMGGGGGATDIRLNDGTLLSRMIVAGGGAGGAMCYRSKTTTTTSWVTKFNYTATSVNQTKTIIGSINGYNIEYDSNLYQNNQLRWYNFWINANCFNNGDSIKISITLKTNEWFRVGYSPDTYTFADGQSTDYSSSPITITWSKPYTYFGISVRCYASTPSITVTIQRQESSSSTTTSNESQVGGVGGGTTGGGYSSTYQGKQSAAGTGGAFGQGAAQSVTNYRYCSGAGGGGWYGGGGGQCSDSSMTYCKYSGGGSGFVNTAASAGNRPSGYTGLQLDSGTTYSGSSSFPNTAGTGRETGHAGNGYARITRVA